MIKVIDIQNYIAKILKKTFPTYPVYVEDNREGIVGDAFIVSVRPLLTTGAMDYKNKLVNVDIAYLSKNGTNEENIIMAEELEDIFGLVLRVKNRKLYIEDLSISTVDTVLNLAFTLDYNVGVVTRYDKEDKKDLGYDDGDIRYMEELEIRR